MTRKKNTLRLKRKQRERLSKIRVEIDFAKALPTSYLPTAWKVNASFNTSPSSAKTSYLMRLPPELRTVIYGYVLSTPWTIDLYQRKRSWAVDKNLELRYFLSTGLSLPLLRVSKEIRREALPEYFKLNSLVLHTPLDAFHRAASWLEQIPRCCGKKPFGNFRFQLYYCRWAEISRAEALVQLLASGMLELDLSHIDVSAPGRLTESTPSDRLITMSDVQGGMYMQQCLEEAMLLGVTAREQTWSARKVTRQFETLMALKVPLKHLGTYKQAKKVRERKAEKRERRKQRREAGES